VSCEHVSFTLQPSSAVRNPAHMNRANFENYHKCTRQDIKAFYCAGFDDASLNCSSWISNCDLRGRRSTYLTILKRAWSANFKMVWYILLRPLRPELDGRQSFSWSNLRKHHQNQQNCRPLAWDEVVVDLIQSSFNFSIVLKSKEGRNKASRLSLCRLLWASFHHTT
jgi:hypothetical protein